MPSRLIILNSLLGLIPSLALCVILGANNLSTCLGMSIGARRLPYTQAIALASLGLMAGVLLEGGKLAGAITQIASTSDPHFTFIVTISSFILMAFLTYKRLPISLSQVAVGAVIGGALAQGIEVNWTFAVIVASSWVLTPISGFLCANGLSRVTLKLGRNIRGLFTQNVLYSYLTIISGIYASYTLGANTVGLIIGMVNAPESDSLLVSILLGFATVIGMIVLSRATTLSVAENIVGLNPAGSFSAQAGGAATVHGFTQFGIPVSVSQAVVGGVFGATIPRKIVVRNDRLTREIILGWTVAPVMGAVLAVILSFVV